MTRDEFKVIVKGLKAVYTMPSFIPDADAFDVWYGMLSDLPYKLASFAAQSWMSKSPKVPTIADIRQEAARATQGETMTGMEAWTNYVLPAIRQSSYYAKEAYDWLPDDIKRCVTPDWLRECARDENFNPGVASSNFIRSFQTIQARKEQDRLVSPKVLSLIKEIKGIELLEVTKDDK